MSFPAASIGGSPTRCGGRTELYPRTVLHVGSFNCVRFVTFVKIPFPILAARNRVGRREATCHSSSSIHWQRRSPGAIPCR